MQNAMPQGLMNQAVAKPKTPKALSSREWMATERLNVQCAKVLRRLEEMSPTAIPFVKAGDGFVAAGQGWRFEVKRYFDGPPWEEPRINEARYVTSAKVILTSGTFSHSFDLPKEEAAEWYTKFQGAVEERQEIERCERMEALAAGVEGALGAEALVFDKVTALQVGEAWRAARRAEEQRGVLTVGYGKSRVQKHWEQLNRYYGKGRI